MTTAVFYQPQHFNLSGLQGISDKTLAMHFKLYEGYVRVTLTHCRFCTGRANYAYRSRS